MIMTQKKKLQSRSIDQHTTERTGNQIVKIFVILTRYHITRPIRIRKGIEKGLQTPLE